MLNDTHHCYALIIKASLALGSRQSVLWDCCLETINHRPRTQQGQHRHFYVGVIIISLTVKAKITMN